MISSVCVLSLMTSYMVIFAVKPSLEQIDTLTSYIDLSTLITLVLCGILVTQLKMINIRYNRTIKRALRYILTKRFKIHNASFLRGVVRRLLTITLILSSIQLSNSAFKLFHLHVRSTSSS
jgi:hypothetical protein